MLSAPPVPPSPTDIRRRPGAKVLTALLWIILALGMTIGLVTWVRQIAPLKIDEKTTLTLLHSETMRFLVTRRTAAQIVVEVEEGDWLGNWHGMLWATVHLHYGVDLMKVSADDIRRDGEEIVVKLPPPQMLEFAVQPGTVGYMSKATAVPKIQELFLIDRRRELENRLGQRMMDFATREGLLPSREQILDELNTAAVMLSSAADLKLRFE